MNGFGPVGGQILADCIKQNNCLQEFNINGNRLNTTNAFAIAQALSSNETLHVLKVIIHLFIIFIERNCHTKSILDG
jgi:Ran GTPase-activating protein (RanGAP) involved in mRNA processing and transport